MESHSKRNIQSGERYSHLFPVAKNSTATVVTVQQNGNVGIGTTTPQAILDLNGTGTTQSALVVPRETSALRPYGVNGMIRYNTNTSKFEAYENGVWTNMVGAGTVGTVTSIVAGTGISPNTITANGTLNVDVGVTNGKIVQLGVGGQLPAVDGNPSPIETFRDNSRGAGPDETVEDDIIRIMLTSSGSGAGMHPTARVGTHG